MKSIRLTLSLALITLCTAAYAQSEAAKSFETLKTLAGSWEGTVTTVPKVPEMDGKTMHVTLRVTSMGHTLMHEMTSPDRPDDPITMLYVEDGRLLLTHYCDADNRPRMTGKMSQDGKSVEFEFLDVTGNMKYGHMHRAAFNTIDENHHSEDWVFMLPGDKHVQAHVELKRKQ
ncbi:MAG TPA: hypothetical protein VNA69_17560 [Thermoanaerobaculia bacterium]|nr:hypothetical protein [Thermoanaerobaculia bacterium]